MMGYKNRTHRQKRIISERKFNRIFISNLHKAGVAYRSTNLTAQRSLEACKVGDIVYARFACKTQPTDRLQTFCIRYRDWETDRKSTRLNSSHSAKSRMPSSA